MSIYGEDLAWIHDVGFGDFARESAPGVLALLREAGIDRGLVVDLGCGSGIWAEELIAAGYRVLGIDASPAMIEIARARVPAAEFRVASLFDAEIPTCAVVTSLDECLSYRSDPDDDAKLPGLFERIHRALQPGGLFVFDVVQPGREAPPGGPHRRWRDGEEWAVLIEAGEDREHRTLSRRIISFRRVGELYRRSDEIHLLRLHEPPEIVFLLERAGFSVRLLKGYGARPFVAGQIGFAAQR